MCERGVGFLIAPWGGILIEVLVEGLVVSFLDVLNGKDGSSTLFSFCCDAIRVRILSWIGKERNECHLS